MRRHELSDEQWELIKGLMPRQERGGRWNDHRTTLNGMMWILRPGAPWRDLPERYGKWKSVYDRFRRWTCDGTFTRMLRALRVRLDKDGKIDWDLWLVDGSSIRASRAAAGAGKGGAPKSRKTTLWAARAADSGANSTWLLTAEAFPWSRSSPRGRCMNPSSSKQS
jgi:transposase